MTEQNKTSTVLSPFMARFVTEQNVVECLETSCFYSIVKNTEFTWLAVKQDCEIAAEGKDIQSFMASSVSDDFVPFGVFCKIVSSEGGAKGYVVNTAKLVFTADRMNAILRKCSTVIDTGLWRTDAIEERGNLTALFSQAMADSSLYKTMFQMGVEPKLKIGALTYTKTDEGQVVMLQPVEITISHDEYINRFGVFARFVKQHDLKEVNIPAFSMA